jgi:hypothetical protein
LGKFLTSLNILQNDLKRHVPIIKENLLYRNFYFEVHQPKNPWVKTKRSKKKNPRLNLFEDTFC